MENTGTEKVLEILRLLPVAYPNAGCELDFSDPFQLLVAVILSAQCTDKRVNQVTKKLFLVAKTPAEFAALEQEQLEKLIFSCGFYRNKAANIIAAARDIQSRFGGSVPDSLDKLVSLAGVGRKTANVVLSVAFGQDAIAVDTHVFRVSRRLELSAGSTPKDVERDLSQLFAGEHLGKIHHLLIFHGRYCCHSRRPACCQCCISHICRSADKNI